MSKQDDELRKYLTKRLDGLMHVPDPKLEVTTVPTLVEIIMQKIYKHFNPKSDSFTKAEVLRAIGGVHRIFTTDLNGSAKASGYALAITDITEALGLTSKEDK